MEVIMAISMATLERCSATKGHKSKPSTAILIACCTFGNPRLPHLRILNEKCLPIHWVVDSSEKIILSYIKYFPPNVLNSESGTMKSLFCGCWLLVAIGQKFPWIADYPGNSVQRTCIDERAVSRCIFYDMQSVILWLKDAVMQSTTEGGLYVPAGLF